MADKDKPKVTQLPYMGPPKDDAKEKEDKRVSKTMPTTTGTKLAVPMSPDYRDRNYAKGGAVKKMASGGTPDIDAENAKQDALLRKERKAYEDYKAQEKTENEAPRKAIKDAAKSVMGAGKHMYTQTMRTIKTPKSNSKAGESATENMKEYGMKSGGMTASARADGIAQRGKTRGKIC